MRETKYNWRCNQCGKKGRGKPKACPACGGPVKVDPLFYPYMEWRENGKRKRTSLGGPGGRPGGFTRVKDSKAVEAAAEHAKSEGTFIAPSKQTVGEYLDLWLAGIQSTVRYSTWKGYRSYVRTHVVPALGRIPLQGLTAAHLNKLYANLLEKGLSPTSVRQCHVIVHRSLRDAVKEGRLSRNVADLASPPAPRRTEMKVWTGEEAARFLKYVSDHRLYAAWALFLSAGLRRGELAALRWSDVDGDQLSIRKTLIQSGWEIRFSEPKTKKSVRSIALDPRMLAILKAHKVAQAQERLAAGPLWEDHGLIFCAPDGRPLHPATLSTQFERLSKEAGVPKIRLHDCRHTFASLALKAKVPAKVVSEILGHSSIGITLDTYSHLLPGLQEEAASLVAGMLFSNK